LSTTSLSSTFDFWDVVFVFFPCCIRWIPMLPQQNTDVSVDDFATTKLICSVAWMFGVAADDFSCWL
jgi:hypothetical protein